LPADFAGEALKLCTDSTSLLVQFILIKLIFVLGLVPRGWRCKSACFRYFWPSLPVPGRQPNGPLFGSSCFGNKAKIRVLETLIGFLA